MNAAIGRRRPHGLRIQVLNQHLRDRSFRDTCMDRLGKNLFGAHLVNDPIDARSGTAELRRQRFDCGALPIRRQNQRPGLLIERTAHLRHNRLIGEVAIMVLDRIANDLGDRCSFWQFGPTAGVLASYERGVHDEFVVPFIIEELGKPVATVEDGDAIIFFNFRPDRAIQLSRTFTDAQFDGFDTGTKEFTDLKFVTFTHYSDEVVADIAYSDENLENTSVKSFPKMG